MLAWWRELKICREMTFPPLFWSKQPGSYRCLVVRYSSTVAPINRGVPVFSIVRLAVVRSHQEHAKTRCLHMYYYALFSTFPCSGNPHIAYSSTELSRLSTSCSENNSPPFCKDLLHIGHNTSGILLFRPICLVIEIITDSLQHFSKYYEI